MSLKYVLGGVIVLAIGILILTICSSTAVHEFIWETFSGIGSQ